MPILKIKAIVWIIILIYTPICLQGQIESGHRSDEEQITAVLNDYIIGTSYNEADRLSRAFMPEANMYLDHPERPLFVMKIEEYASRVAKKEAGVFNGRVSNIISIDRFENIACAKLEVLIPGVDKRFIDLMLLKKLEDGWKIISKTAASQASTKSTNKVLVVVSSNSTNKNTDIGVIGNSFHDIVISYNLYQKAGYHVDIISPSGGAIPIANINSGDSLQLQHLYNKDFMYALSHTQKPNEIQTGNYQIIQFIGNSAWMNDITNNQVINDIAMSIYQENNGVITAIGNGIPHVLNLKSTDGQYFINKKNVAIFSENEKGNRLGAKLRQRGAILQNSIIGTPHTGSNNRIVTGLNSASSEMVIMKSIEIAKQLKTDIKE